MNWTKNFSAAITICNKEGVITYLNDQAAAMFANNGGYDLIGKNLSECHRQSSTEKMAEIMRSGKPHVYTTEKKGTKRLFYQAPHIENGEVLGIVDLAMEIPLDIPHHIRS
jgi:sensor histidine kinase regulating citrate/malate metabolism